MALLAPRDLGAHAIARHGTAHEHHELVSARYALPAIGEGGDVQLDDVSGARRHEGQCTRCACLSRTGSGRAGPRFPHAWQLSTPCGAKWLWTKRRSC